MIYMDYTHSFVVVSFYIDLVAYRELINQCGTRHVPKTFTTIYSLFVKVYLN